MKTFILRFDISFLSNIISYHFSEYALSGFPLLFLTTSLYFLCIIPIAWLFRLPYRSLFQNSSFPAQALHTLAVFPMLFMVREVEQYVAQPYDDFTPWTAIHILPFRKSAPINYFTHQDLPTCHILFKLRGICLF